MTGNGPLDRLRYHTSGAVERGEATAIVGMTADHVRELSDTMEFDHVVEIHADGTITHGPAGVYAPDLTDDTLTGDGWEFASYGYTGQDSYRGPIMHNSEYIGSRLARDILSSPGIYCAIVAYWTPDDETEDTLAEGWAIVRYIG